MKRSLSKAALWIGSQFLALANWLDLLNDGSHPSDEWNGRP